LRSKAQYELHFKKWGFRKNRTKDDWKIVAQKVGKRKREHKESEVYIDGNLIHSKKVKKAISRYGSMPATAEMQLQGNHIRVISNLRSSLWRQRRRRECRRVSSFAHHYQRMPPLHQWVPYHHQPTACQHQRTRSLFW
jgi:hypothetical protein